MRPASLDECPIPEWWDVNDYLNEVDKKVTQLIKRIKDEQQNVDPTKRALHDALKFLD
jgi:hypothetical protein